MRQRGYTLIELLIVIVVIGIITAVIVAMVDPIGRFIKARDSERKLTLKELSRVMDSYLVGVGHYPSFNTPPELNPTGWACIRQTNMGTLITTGSIKNIPQDPSRGLTCPCYLYAVDGSMTKYALFSQLENYEDPNASSPKPTPDPSIISGTMNASNTTFTVNSGTCTGTTFNYWITSSAPGFVATGPPIPGGGAPIPPAPVITPIPTPDLTGIVANWKFDEAPGSTTFADSSGNNLTGNVNGLQIVSAGCRSGSCLQNTGMNAFASVPYNSLFNITQNVTYNVWAKIRAQSTSYWPELLARTASSGYGIRQNKNTGSNGWAIYFEHEDTPCNHSVYNYTTINYNVSDGNWHMYTMTQNGSLLKTYFDGVPVGTGISFSQFCSDTISPVILGGAYFTGKIDEAKIYDKALTDSEVLSLYNTFPKAVVPTPPTNGLVGYWNMDDVPSWNGTSGEVKDLAGTNHGTATNATNTTDSFLPAYKTAGNFNGTDTYITIPDAPSLRATNALSVSTWVYISPTPPAINKAIVSKRDGFNVNEAFILWRRGSDGKAGFGITTEGNNETDVLGTTTLDVSTWYYVTGVFDGISLKIYVDGTLEGTQALTGSIYQSTANLAIGSSTGGHVSEIWPGYIDDVRFYNRALNDTEIATIFNANPPPDITSNVAGYWRMDENSWNGTAGEVTDSSGSGNNGTSIGGANTTNSPAKFGRAGSFNGTSSFLSMGDINTVEGLSAITGCAWINPSTLGSVNPIMLKGSSSSDYIWYFAIGTTYGSPNALNFQMRTLSPEGFSVATSFSTGTWNHVCFSWDGSTVSLYKNGEKIGSQSTTGTMSSNATSMTVGYYQNGGSPFFFNGYIDDVRVYNRALTDSDVQTLYNYAP